MNFKADAGKTAGPSLSGKRLWRPAVAALCAIAIAGCGGGGGDSAPATPAPNPSPPSPTLPAPTPPSPTPSPSPAPVPAPQISNAPTSRATAAGAAVTFNVTAVGNGPFSYQWRRNGAVIAGATAASYSISQVTSSNDGDRYSVVVTNSGGSATSADAVLTVFAVPAATTSCILGTPTSTVITTAAVGKPVGIALAGCTIALVNVSWQQTGGPALTPLAARTQALHLEPTIAGSYQYTATTIDANNVSRTIPVTVNVPAASGATTAVVLRTSQAVREGQRGSMRAWPLNSPAGASVVWRQVEGPAVELDLSDSQRAIFTAPQVDKDTVLRFRAELRAGTTLLDSSDALVVVENLPTPPSGQLFDDATFFASRVYPYKSGSAYANQLVGCVYSPALYATGTTSLSTNLCRFSQLPLIAQSSADPNLPTVAEVMDRVVVSHDWMGQVFESFLNTQDVNGDFRRLLGSVTAVVIGAHVRPAFFWQATGAIYLDADYFWLTPEQRDVISEVPDFRSGYDAELNYTGLWRYVIGNNQAQLFFPNDDRTSRDISYLVYELGDLLYHELTHANDAYPYGQRAGFGQNQYAFEAAQDAATAALGSAYPLLSQTMFDLAKVKFFGQTATAAQKALTPTQVGVLFSTDRATDEYNYSVSPDSSPSNVSAEDPAMLMEEFMMLHRHGVRRDVAMTNKFRSGLTGSDLLVAWGQRGRIAEAAVRPRIKLVAATIAPWISAAEIDAKLDAAAPIAMRVGQSWTSNLTLPGPLGFRAGFQGVAAIRVEDQLRLMERRRQVRELKLRHDLNARLQRAVH
jgi:hypothetical protein